MTNHSPITLNFDPGTVFSRIAISALDQDSKFAVKSSCYACVAHAIREGLVQDDDEIILVGRNGNAHHGIVVRDDQLIVDSFIEGARYDVNNGVYSNDHILLDENGKREFSKIAGFTVRAFKDYFRPELLNVPAGAYYPEVSAE